MGVFVATKVIKMMIAENKEIKKSRVLILGFAFKENCPDIRNTKVIDIFKELKSFGTEVDVYDPWVNGHDVEKMFGVEMLKNLINKNYDAIILAVAHRQFVNLDFEQFQKKGALIFDTKSFIDRDFVNARL